MNREDIIKLAREANVPYDPWPNSEYNKNLERFAALVAAAEREACEEVATDPDHLVPHWPQATIQQSIAAAIRARGETK